MLMVVSQRRYRAIVEYDGTEFSGYQLQKVGRTVQGEIEKSLRKVTQSNIRIVGAGRTDAGVHATGQVIAFSVAWKHALVDLHRALNATLPADIILQELRVAADDFHPRFDALSRSYQYSIVNQPWPSVLRRRYAFHVKERLDVTAMNEASKLLTGLHDFASFGKPPHGKNTVREIIEAQWAVDGSMVNFGITANAFLYQMVRRVVGTLIKVGLGQLIVDEVKDILKARDLARSAEPAPAQGLCLVNVTYSSEDL